MADAGQDPANSMSTPSTGQGAAGSKLGNNVEGVMVKHPDNSEYYRSLQIVLGTVCGVFGLLGLLLVILLLYRHCKKRRSQNYSTGSRGQHELHSSISIDLDQKHVPSVLILYAYDCAAHEKVVSALAGYLIEACNCNVHLDVFEDQIIFDRGLDDWLVDRLQEVDYIIVMCSVGARLRCAKKRVRFKYDPNRKIPDYFAVAVDYVAEKMRVERSKGLPMSKYIVTYMDYSTVSDIPHQLETGSKFCLMRDILPLFCHLHGTSAEPTKNGIIWPDVTEQTYENSELGAELKVSIESAKEFFKCNPNWVEDSMECVPPVPSKSKSRHNRKSSLEPLLGDIKISLPQKDEQQIVDTTVDVHSQTLPRSIKQNHLDLVGSLQNRQNSLPSSLSSHQTLSTPPPQTHTSKSYDSFHSPSMYEEYDALPCLVCGQEDDLHHSKVKCKTRMHIHRQGTLDSEDELSYKVKSKSLPTVYGPSLQSSQTVYQVEVHKEWGDPEGKLSPTDSQDSGSNKDLAIDDLENDLQSIIMPSGSLHYGAKTLAEKSFPLHLQIPSSMFSGTDLCHPTATEAALVLQPLKKAKEEEQSSKGSLEEQLFQLKDIRL